RRRHTRFSRDWSSDVCSSDLRENAKTLVVIGMGKLPETLNWRSWSEKVIPKISVWFGEYNVPVFDNVALGVIRFVCPPHFRNHRSEERRVGKQVGRTRRA